MFGFNSFLTEIIPARRCTGTIFKGSKSKGTDSQFMVMHLQYPTDNIISVGSKHLLLYILMITFIAGYQTHPVVPITSFI